MLLPNVLPNFLSVQYRVKVDDTPWLDAVLDRMGMRITLGSVPPRTSVLHPCVPTLWALAGEKKALLSTRTTAAIHGHNTKKSPYLSTTTRLTLVFRWRKWSSEYGTERFHHDIIGVTFCHKDSESPLCDRRRERSREAPTKTMPSLRMTFRKPGGR